MDVGEAPAGDGLTVPLRMHNLLLALAGRVDDSALTQAHELVARADVDEAAELTTGTLIAGGIPVRAAERRELAQVLEMSRCDATLVDELFVDELAPTNTHRFSGDAAEYGAPEAGVADAIERTVRVLPDVRAVHAVWRYTPAGAVSGPLPKRVVLVEVGPEGNPPAVAYRVDVALRRAGINAVVEVLSSWADRSGYHESALASARLAFSGQEGGAAATASRPSGPASWDPQASRRTSVPQPTPPPSAPPPQSNAPRQNSHGPQAPRVAPPRGHRRTQPETATSEPKHEAAPRSEPQPRPEGHHRPEHQPERESRRQAESQRQPEPQWHSAESWQLAQENQNGSGDPGAGAEPMEVPAGSEPWDAAFQEPAADVPAVDPATSSTATADAGTADPAESVEQESRAASTTEMSPAEMAQLRQALAEDPEKGRQIAASVRPGEVVEIPELDLNDPQLSERDRELLRELHAELAARERAEATRNGVNGSQS